jgi:radical SAM protein with 4Fe4S-binding SPASM domain
MTDQVKTRQILRLLFWESTIRCNLACAHCRRIESDDTAYLDLSTFNAKNLIDQTAMLGKMQSFMPILVFSGGEPLCREDIFELIKTARSQGMTPALATNGTLINANIADQILNSGVMRVSVSLDGATSEVHNRLRRLEGSFERAIEGIGYLRERDIPFQINMTLTRHNAHQLNEIYVLAKSLGAVAVHIFMLVPVGCGISLSNTDMLSPEQYEQKMLEIYKLDMRGELQMKVTCGPHYERVKKQEKASSGIKSNHEIKHETSRGCLAGLGVLFVSHQGDIFPCGYLPIKCGNVLEDKLSDVWYENKDLARMRNTNELEGKCGVCGYRQICGGCRGRAYASTGNYMTEEPFCAYVPLEAVR